MGHDVVVVDQAQLPSDTISTHQIARTGVVALHRWGLLADLVATGGPPAIRQVTFTSGLESTTRVIKYRLGVDCQHSIVDQSRKRSAVFDIITNGVPVAIEVDAGRS
jgi:hypothetical protein